MPLKPGDELKGRYKIISVIGRGGMGSVYLSEDWLYKDKCAIKEMSNNFTEEEEREGAIKRFKNEAQILVKIQHKNIPGIIDYFIENNSYYLVMKYVEGENLQEIMDKSKEKKFPANRIIDLGVQICDVLTYLHSHKPDPIVFRDIKPTNIMIEPGGNIMLVDFGIAKVLQPKKAGTITGTPGFASPEQYQGLAYPVSDIYSLGATLHYLYTGRDPYREAPFSFPDISVKGNADLGKAIMKALAMKMEDRYETAKEMRDALLFCRKTEIKLSSPEFIPEIESGEKPENKNASVEGKTSPEDKKEESEDEALTSEPKVPTEAFLKSPEEVRKKRSIAKFFRGLFSFLVILILLGVAFFVLKDYLKTRKIDAFLDEAREFLKDEDYKNAIEKYREALELEPELLEAHRGLGKAYTEGEEYDYAKLSLERAFEIDREDEETILAMANFYLKKEDIFNAQIWYKKVLVINEDNLEAINGLGDTYYGEKEYLQAISEYKKLLALEPDSIPVRLKIASAYKEDEDYENAMKWYTLALEVKDNTPEARFGIADIYILGNKYDDAIVQYKKVLKYDSRNVEAKEGIGDVYKKKKDYDRAIKWYDEALDIDGNSIKANRGKADIYISRKEKLDEALEKLELVMKLDPDNALNYNSMGRYYVSQKEYDKAIDSYEKAIDLDEERAVIHFNLGLVYAYKEDYDRAIESYEKAIELEPADPYFHYNLGRAYYKKERFEDAVKEYNIAIKIKPDYAPPYYDLGKIYLSMKKFQEAIVYFKKVIELDPDSDLAKEAEKGIKFAQYYGY